jgi:hypothetical protein
MIARTSQSIPVVRHPTLQTTLMLPPWKRPANGRGVGVNVFSWDSLGEELLLQVPSVRSVNAEA